MILLLALVAGCAGPAADDSAGPSLPGAACNPLAAAASCLLPFPSDAWLVDGQVRIPTEALPRFELSGSDAPQPLDFLALHPAAGFSPVPTLLAGFDVALADDALVFLTDDPAASLADASPTRIVDAVTGERVAHFAELDPLAAPEDRTYLVLHPYERLREGHRYVVAVHGLAAADGGLAPAPAGFAAIRDGEVAGEHAALAERYEAEVLPILADIPREALQLAWDFTVRPEGDATGGMEEARAAGLAAMDAEGVTVTVDVEQHDVDDRIARRVEGRLRVPLLLEADAPGAALHRVDGAVAVNGWFEVPFLALVPRGADGTARALQVGHGFFGSRHEADADYVRTLAHDHGFVVFAVDWQGMSEPDRGDVLDRIVLDPATMLAFIDRTHQGMVNQVALARAVRTTLAAAPALQGDDGAPLYDPSAVYFYGNSQGSILGTVYGAIAPEVDRVALGVGGAGFSLMMMRALPFVSFAIVLQAGLPDSRALLELTALAQGSFDRIDPGLYGPWVRTPPFPDGPATREVLVQVGRGDAAVPTVAARLQARALEAPLLVPTAGPVWGLAEAAAPTPSAYVEIDFGMPEPWAGTQADLQSPENEVHDTVRTLASVNEQLDRFLRPDGAVEQTCDDICDPE